MSLHRLRVDDADWRPHPFALAPSIVGAALIAWSVHAYAQMPNGQGGASPRAEPWQAAVGLYLLGWLAVLAVLLRAMWLQAGPRHGRALARLWGLS